MTKIGMLVARVALTTLGLAGCGNLSADCTAVGRIAVTFTLHDAASHADVTTGALATLTGATFTDSVTVPSGQARYGIGAERAGAVRLSIQAPGYARWEQALTIQRAGPCDQLQSVQLDIQLQPAGST